MKTSKPKRLERKLTIRMVQVQALALILFFGAGVYPLVVSPILTALGDARPLDANVMTIFAQSLTGIEGDRITAKPNMELDKIHSEYPTMWIYAVTEAGAAASFGTLPELLGTASDQLWQLEALEVRPVGGGEGAVALKTEISPIGPVRVVTGNGPTVGAASIIGWISAFIAAAIAAVVLLVCSIVIPIVVRREMRGLKIVAEQAQLIHIGARGTRLSADGVPQEVQPLVSAVNGALDRLDESHAERERFLADSAHELRTPIAILQTRIETEAAFPAKSRLLLDVARLSSLADQLLDLQRMDLAGNVFVPVDLVELGGQVVGDLAPLANAAGYELSLMATEAPVYINGDPASLSRALINVVQNAIAYGGQRGEILVEVNRYGTIAISDEGPGIPPPDRDRVFEPFFRLKPSSRGAGLGLNLVEAIISRHHGRVAIVDAASGGACVVIDLPLLGATNRSALPGWARA
ncbi:two-component sensor histidine kinase [Devosia yakushimensis]|uniref:histidine kinase n=1 Tax=Devosia yakushimensis TaxID=470028 RepID=A0ABQ5UIH8_9HYPH|nr:HAMP domain-containing sensor histidine kinase [Devosia yakushimensis]GLQ10975.1 two-component sensor histidine kinase [Devosia yakushimensis]